MGDSTLATGGAGAYLMGTVLEMHFKDSDSNARSDLFVKEINTNTSKSFNISDYQIIGIGGDKNKTVIVQRNPIKRLSVTNSLFYNPF
jgi:hypothetical protein